MACIILQKGATYDGYYDNTDIYKRIAALVEVE